MNIDRTDLKERMIENYTKLEEPGKAKIVSLKNTRTHFDSLFEDTDDSDVYSCYVDFRCGWAEAALALQAVIGAALKNGGHYQEASISK